MLGRRSSLGDPGCRRSGRWAPPSGTVMPAGTDAARLGPVRWGKEREEASWAMCVPALTNWITPAVDGKGSASVAAVASPWNRGRFTYVNGLVRYRHITVYEKSCSSITRLRILCLGMLFILCFISIFTCHRIIRLTAAITYCNMKNGRVLPADALWKYPGLGFVHCIFTPDLH